jgi:hypothetical protein
MVWVPTLRPNQADHAPSKHSIEMPYTLLDELSCLWAVHAARWS